MPRGPLPAPEQKRARRNPATFPTTELERGRRAVDAPGLPKAPGGQRWLAATRDWWQTWRESPQAALFEETDWLALRLLAPLVDSYFREPTPAKLAEIRQGHAKLGATPEDRLRLRWRFLEAEAETEGTQPPTRRPARARKDPRLELVKGRRGG
jgi:hypothetical protein